MPRVKQDAAGRGGRDEKDHHRDDYSGTEHQLRETRGPVRLGALMSFRGRSRSRGPRGISEALTAASTERCSLLPHPSATATDIRHAFITPPGKTCNAPLWSHMGLLGLKVSASHLRPPQANKSTMMLSSHPAHVKAWR